MTSDGTNTYIWDRANRLSSMGGISYAYNGDGNRVSQTANAIVTKYLLDLQPGLALVIGQTIGSDTTRYIHSMRGIHAIQLPDDNWHSVMPDGLGSIRSVIDSDGAVLQSMNYTPYGVPDAAYPWAFTGEQRDGTGLQYHRARYYNPALGTWAKKRSDPFINSINTRCQAPVAAKTSPACALVGRRLRPQVTPPTLAQTLLKPAGR